MMGTPDLDDLYAEIILDHYRSPRNEGLLPEPDLQAEGFNPFCGDRVVLTLALGEDGCIERVGFEGEGCSISQASASIMTELLKGKSVSEVHGLNTAFRALMADAELPDGQTPDDLGELTALEGVKRFPVRIKCALLPWATLQDALGEEGAQTP